MTERIDRSLVWLRGRLQPEDGQALTEYALILALIVVAATVTALTGIGTDVKDWLNGVTSAVAGV